jgi:hypothetical protein
MSGSFNSFQLRSDGDVFLSPIFERFRPSVPLSISLKEVLL